MSADDPMTQAGNWSCFPGGAPPESVLRGWRALLGLPRAAQQNLWHLLDAALQDPTNPDNRQLVEAYAQRFEANVAHVVAAVQACDFLLRQGAAMGVPLAGFRSDLEALSADDPVGVELLTARYEAVREMLRGRMLEDVLADHGNVLTGFDWRVDRLHATSRGELEGTPVLLLKLRYRRGNEEQELALQLPPEAVSTLGAFCSQFAPTADDGSGDPANSETPSS